MPRKLLFVLITFLIILACKETKRDLPVKQKANLADTLNNIDSDSDPKDRDVWQHPEYVIKLLGDISDQTVADIGAGTGYFSFKILPKAKKLIAIDIDDRFIKLMDQKIKSFPQDQKTKFEARLASPEDPKLSENEIQTALVVNTYIYIQNRPQYFKNLKKNLSNKGRLVIIDFKNIDLPVGPPVSIKLSGNQIIEELKQAGYSNISLDNNLLDYQYVVVAENLK
ncbi:MAG TPA: class I SAM-dependent methyltransferase [Saprospiraceae bacterium]|nr:class I SAM-dependent methyltransferase [Saprospiraceae bacterium]